MTWKGKAANSPVVVDGVVVDAADVGVVVVDAAASPVVGDGVVFADAAAVVRVSFVTSDVIIVSLTRIFIAQNIC